MLASFSYCKWQTAGCRTGNKTKHVLLHLPQESGFLLAPLALDLLPVAASPSLPLMTTRQCSLEGTNQDMAVESMTVIFWILSQWYAQRDCDNSIMHYQVLSNEGHYIVKLNVYKCHLLNHSCVFVCLYCIKHTNHSHHLSLQWMHIQLMDVGQQHVHCL